jgi:hypothetical protein
MTERVARPEPPRAEEALTNAVLDFRPSRHGLHFPNRFVPGAAQRLIDPGASVMGLCGGMAFVVRDLFERGIDPPRVTEPPTKGSRRYRSLFRRQVQSFDWLRLPLRFWALAALHRDPPTAWSRLLRRAPLGGLVRSREWPRIRAEIDAGRLPQVGLVRDRSANPFRLVRNHQVVAWGYRVEPNLVSLRIYDPNWPDRDDVELCINLRDGAARFSQSTGEPLHGFFLAPYAPAPAIPRAWRTPS